MSREIARRTSSLQPSDVVYGELIEAVRDHRLCGQFHPVVDGFVECCCGDTHDLDPYLCCGCGHHHPMDSGCLPSGPCGSFHCCIN